MVGFAIFYCFFSYKFK